MQKQLALVAILTGLSQVAAFFKLWFTARVFGVSAELDGYNLALVLPTLMSGVLAGVVQTGFFPMRAQLSALGRPGATEAFERIVFWVCAALGVVCAFSIWSAAPKLATLLVPSGQDAVARAFLLSMPAAAALLALNAMGDCIGFLLAMRGRFVYAASAPIANGLLGGLVLALSPESGLIGLLAGTLLGLMAQVAICVVGLRNAGFNLLGSLDYWDQASPRLREMTRLGGWVLPGVFFSNMVVSLPPIWVAGFGEGAVSAFGYAYRFHSSLVQLLVMGSATIVLARFSELVAADDHASVRRLLHQAAVLSLAIGGASVAGVWWYGEAVLGWLFSGRFDAEAAAKVTAIWTWLTAGLGFALLGNVFAKLWQAQSRPKLISMMACASLVVLCLCFFTLKALIGELAVAAAMTGASAIVVLLGLGFLGTSSRQTSPQ